MFKLDIEDILAWNERIQNNFVLHNEAFTRKQCFDV